MAWDIAILLEWQIIAIVLLTALATPLVVKRRPVAVTVTESSQRALRRPDEAAAIAAITAQVSHNLRAAETARSRLMADLSR